MENQTEAEYEIHTTEEVYKIEDKSLINVDDCIDSFKKVSEEQNTNPFSGLFSMIHQVLTDNKQVMSDVINVASNASKKINLDSFKTHEINLEFISIKQFLCTIQKLDIDDNSDWIVSLRQSSINLSELLSEENYDEIKSSQEVSVEVKNIRKLYLQYLHKKLTIELSSLENDIFNTDSQEYTVDDLLKLKSIETSLKLN